MKKLVLLLMLFGVARSFGAVATNVQNLSQFGTTNRAMPGDGIGLSTRYATGSERLMGIQVTNLIRSLNALGIGTNTVLVSGGTNITIVTTRTGSNVTYEISVSTSESSMTNALLHAGPTNGSVGALILTAGTNILLATDGTNRVINTLNNVSLVDVTNIVAGATNGFTSVSPPVSSVQYNSNGVQSGSSAFVFTNGLVGIGTNIPTYPLHIFNSDISAPSIEVSYATGAGNTTAFQIRNGAGSTNFSAGVDGLVHSATIQNSGTVTSDVATVTSLNVKGGTLGAGKVLTDTGGTGSATWQSFTASLSNTTNFINLSVQAAKLPGNDNPAIGSGYKAWELVYYKTNIAGSVAALSANWQFVVPPDYGTNSLQLYMQQMVLQTNGPATSNTIFCASIWKTTPGDSKDVHTNTIFNTEVCVTNIWSASTSGTNILQTSLFTFGTNAPLQPGDLAVLTLKRNGTNDTYIWEAAVTGMQLYYTRP